MRSAGDGVTAISNGNGSSAGSAPPNAVSSSSATTPPGIDGNPCPAIVMVLTMIGKRAASRATVSDKMLTASS
ncbi:hypothetical protein GCM10009848_37120 [Micromonospora lupini]